MFIIIVAGVTSTATAKDHKYEEMWVYYGNFDINVNDKVKIEEHTIRVHSIDEDSPSSILLHYKNDIFKQAYVVDTELNNYIVIEGDLKVKIESISKDYLSVETSVRTLEPTWVLLDEKDMRISDKMQLNDFSITLDDSTGDSYQFIVEYQDSSEYIDLNSNDSKTLYNDFLIEISKKDSEKTVNVKLYQNPIPSIDLYFEGLERSYSPGENIFYELIIENTGDVPLRNICAQIKTNGGDEKSIMISTLLPSESFKEKLNIEASFEPEGYTIDIEGEVLAYTHDRKEHHSSDSVSINVPGYMSIAKRVQPSETTLENSEFEVTLDISNMASDAKKITVIDQIPNGFIQMDNSEMKWDVEVGPGTTKNITYTILSMNPGDYDMGSAAIEWRDGNTDYRVKSNNPGVTIYGADLDVDRYLSKDDIHLDEYLDVNFNIMNKGNENAYVKINDTVPEDMELVYGDTSWNGTVSAGEEYKFSYVLKPLSAGKFDISSLEIRYSDASGHENTIYLQELEFNVNDYQKEGQIKSPESDHPESLASIGRWNTISFLTLSFIFLLALISMVPICGYIFINERKK
ncbi:BatD family protein [Methanosalsum zhilinae]|uniref:BatD family protein n=1 Tax=Methanosalsum zhilinae TaxID=39669 RepID=UPI000662886F|nr:BatD family protein [Methanosalsum zhilinae]